MLAQELARHRYHVWTIVTDARSIISHRGRLALHVQPLVALSCCGAVCCVAGCARRRSRWSPHGWRRGESEEAGDRLKPRCWRHTVYFRTEQRELSAGALILTRNGDLMPVSDVNNAHTGLHLTTCYYRLSCAPLFKVLEMHMHKKCGIKEVLKVFLLCKKSITFYFPYTFRLHDTLNVS